MAKFLSDKYNYIHYIHSEERKTIHPWDVFKEWLNQKFRMFLAGFSIFIFGILIGWILF